MGRKRKNISIREKEAILRKDLRSRRVSMKRVTDDTKKNLTLLSKRAVWVESVNTYTVDAYTILLRELKIK